VPHLVTFNITCTCNVLILLSLSILYQCYVRPCHYKLLLLYISFILFLTLISQIVYVRWHSARKDATFSVVSLSAVKKSRSKICGVPPYKYSIPISKYKYNLATFSTSASPQNFGRTTLRQAMHVHTSFSCALTNTESWSNLVNFGPCTHKLRLVHRSRISVNFRGHDMHFCPKKIGYVSKSIQNSRILHDFCPRNAEFYIIIGRKIFSRFFFFWGGGTCPPCPRLLRLWISA